MYGIIVQPEIATAGEALSNIDTTGMQIKMKIIDQILTGLVSTPGIVVDTDKIIEAMGKIKSTLSTAYSFTTTGISATMTPFQRVIRATTTGLTIKFPASNASGVIAGEDYTIIFPPNVLSAGTAGVTTGDFFNGAVNGTVAGPISITLPSYIRAKSDGTGWWLC